MSDPASASAIQDILEIRRRQGNLLSGTIFETCRNPDAPTSAGADFEGVLMEVAEDSTPPAAVLPQVSPSRDACEANYLQVIRAEQSDDDRLAPALRSAERRLERKARELEELGQYEQSDELRELATAVRRQARLWQRAPVKTARRQ